MESNEIAGMPPENQLLELAMKLGEPYAGGGNRPFRLSDPAALWFVTQGLVDVFAAHLREDDVPTDFKHILRAGPDRLLFPLEEVEDSLVLVVKGLPGSELRRIPVSALTSPEMDARIIEQVNAWVIELSDSIVRDVTHRPRIDRSIGPGSVEEGDRGAAISAQHGIDGIVWIASQEGDLLYLGTEELETSGSGLVPLTSSSWVIQGHRAPVTGFSTTDLGQDGRLLPVLMEFNRLAMGAARTNRTLLLADISNLQTASARHRERSEETARRDLFSVLRGEPSQEDRGSALMRALAPIGSHERIQFKSPRRSTHQASYEGEETLEDILNASGVRGRRVALRRRHRWWLGDSGAMLARRREEGNPVALIPGASGRYRMIDPQNGRSLSVNAQNASTLDEDAYFFYRPLPDSGSRQASSLFALAFNNAWGDLARLAGAGLLSGLASLAPVLFLVAIVNWVLPSGDARMLAIVTLALALVGMTLALLHMLQGTALMRLEGRAAARITAALWDRLLALPSAFFRRFTVGDLGSRAMGFQQLRDQVSGVVVGALLSLVFLIPTFGLLFLFDITWGWLGLIMGILSLAVPLYLGMRQMPHFRRLLAASRLVTGVLLQFISGVGKLRVSGAESSAFAMWATNYREQKAERDAGGGAGRASDCLYLSRSLPGPCRTDGCGLLSW